MPKAPKGRAPGQMSWGPPACLAFFYRFIQLAAMMTRFDFTAPSSLVT